MLPENQNDDVLSSLLLAIDKAVVTAMQKYSMPSVALGICKNGAPYYTKAFGSSMLPNASFPNGYPTNIITPFELGSVTKSYTAMGIMLLQESDKLSIYDPIGLYIEGLPEPWAEIKILHYLSMTAGLFAGGSNTLPWNQIVEETLLKGLYKKSPPGTYYNYSDPSFMLMGQVIEAVSKERYDDYMNKAVLEPLGVRQTQVHTPTHSPQDLATGYVYNQSKSGYEFTGSRWPGSSFSSGAMLASATGITDFISSVQAQKLLNSESYQTMWTPVIPTSKNTTDFGLGWRIVTNAAENKIVSKNGGIPGYSALITIEVIPSDASLDQGYFGIGLACNVTDANDAPDALPKLTQTLFSLLS